MTNPTHYTFTFTAVETELVGRAIQELPARVANPMLAAMQKRIDEQNEAAKEPEVAVAAPRGRPLGSKNRPRPEIVPPEAPLAQQA